MEAKEYEPEDPIGRRIKMTRNQQSITGGASGEAVQTFASLQSRRCWHRLRALRITQTLSGYSRRWAGGDASRS
ncbi:MAG: hypothetical protein IPG64_22935 [Haliea sp.]|nr:hypothetical protein [Haliea sp.]